MNSIRVAQQAKLQSNRTVSDLESLLIKKEEQIDHITADYKIKLDDFHHVRSQVYTISCRTANIDKTLQHVIEENCNYQEILASRKSEYLKKCGILAEQLRLGKSVIRSLHETQQAEKSILADQFKFLDTRLNSHQLQIQQLHDSLEGKSQQCKEMGILCEDLFQQVEPVNM